MKKGEEKPTATPAAAAGEPASTSRNDEQPHADLGRRVQELEEERERLRRANQELQDKHLRARADYENLVRRSSKESQESVRYAKSALLLRLLPLLESLEALVSDLEARLGPDAKASRMMLEDARKILRDEGIREVPGKGHAFNYRLHQAVERVESGSAAEGTIVEVVQRGYQWGEDVLRPGLVKVAVPPKARPPGEHKGATAAQNAPAEGL